MGDVGRTGIEGGPAQEGVSLFIPFLNEREALPIAVEAFCAAFASCDHPFELLLVNDGSTDGSGELAEQLAEQHKPVRVVHHKTNRGYGEALTTGFNRCVHPVITYSDADLPVTPAEFVEALPLLQHADLVVGHPRSRPVSMRRRFYSEAHHRVVRIVFGLEMRNPNFSFKLARRELVREMDLDATGGFIDCQMLLEAKRLEARIVEVPVNFQLRQVGESHFDSPKVAVRSLLEILRHGARHRLRKRS